MTLEMLTHSLFNTLFNMQIKGTKCRYIGIINVPPKTLSWENLTSILRLENWKISDFVNQAGPVVTSHLLFLLAWSRCDTTPATFGHGKVSLVRIISGFMGR